MRNLTRDRTENSYELRSDGLEISDHLDRRARYQKWHPSAYLEKIILFWGKMLGLSQMNILVSEFSFNNRCNLLQFNLKMSIVFRKDLVLKGISPQVCDAVWFTESQPTFRRNTSPPLSVFKNGLFFCLCWLHAALFLAYSLTSKTEAKCPFEMSVDFQQTA